MHADPSKFRIYSRYNPPLGKALKLMESIFPRASYSELNGALIIQREEKLITMYTTGNITMTMASSEEEARQILENLKGIINEAIANGIKAVKHEKIKIDPLNAYKYLPQLDCQKCGDQSCKNFAIKLIAGETSLNSCTPLKDPKYAINLEHLRLING